MDVPVLFLVFKRPKTTRQVFAAIKAARPQRLYIAADGPRHYKADEAELVDEVHRIATAVDWPCEVHTLFRENNLGCRRAVSGAIDWFFEHEEAGIILEDDCLPDLSWFEFAGQLLSTYKYDTRVMCISACHFHGVAHTPEASYFFSRYNHCWGWASWRRAWQLYDRDMQHWPSLRNTDWLLGIGGDPFFQKHWTHMFDLAYEDIQIDSWATRWTFSCWIHNALTVLPSKNLVQNIGLDGSGTHTNHDGNGILSPALESMTFPLKHPDIMVCDVAADRWEDRYIFNIKLDASFPYRLISGSYDTTTHHASCVEFAMHKIQDFQLSLSNTPVFLLAPLSKDGMLLGEAITKICDTLIAAIDDRYPANTIFGVSRWTSQQFLANVQHYPGAIAIDFSSSTTGRVWAKNLCNQAGIKRIPLFKEYSHA